MINTIWTLGHSTRSIEEFISILKSYNIKAVVDVRTVPRSLNNPQYNKENLEGILPKAGFDYIHKKELGGWRHSNKDSVNKGWKKESFRSYADYMQTPEFGEALNWLIEYAQQKNTVIVCAETLPWRCHRSLIADALIVKGYEVIEIFEEGTFRKHKLTVFAVVKDGKITYPAPTQED
jgi:uncharacterized protein (DUF488 family)